MKLSELTENDLIETKHLWRFENSPSTDHFGGTEQILYVDGTGYFFSSEREPKFHPLTGVRIRRVIREEVIEEFNE